MRSGEREMGDVVLNRDELLEVLSAYCTYLRWAESDAVNRYGGETKVSERRVKQLRTAQRFILGGNLVHKTVDGFIDALREYEETTEENTPEAIACEQMWWFLDARTPVEEIKSGTKKLAGTA